MFGPRKRSLALACTLVALVVLLWLFASVSGVAANSQASSRNQPPSASSQEATWATRPPTLRGKILHFVTVENLYDTAVAPSVRTRIIRGDIWERLDNQGNITEFHGLYTSADRKTFYQETYENAVESITVFGKKFPNTVNLPENSGSWCIFRSPPPSSDLTSTLQLSFVNTTALKNDGFQVTLGETTQPLPATPVLAQVKPDLLYPTSHAVSIWTKKTVIAQNMTRTDAEEVGPQNRVLADGVEDIDASGTIVFSHWFSFGSAYAYNPSLVSMAVFSSPQKILAGGCTR